MGANMETNGLPQAFPYQKEVVLDVEDFGGRSLIGLDTGLGKTLVTLWLLKRQRIESFPAVVVCPASVKLQWEAEAIKAGIRPTVLEGQKVPKSVGRKSSTPRMTIINYDILRFWLPVLLKQGISTLIIDESQKIAHRETQQSKACVKLAKASKHVVALSATPLLNRPAELWPTLHAIRPDLYPSFWGFARRFCSPRRTPWGWDYSGASNLDILNSTLNRQLLVRRLKRDVMRDLPEIIRCVVPVELSDPKEYELARDDFFEWLKARRPDRVTSALKAQQLAHISYLLQLTAKLKLRAVVEWCNRWLEETDEKLVVFAIHRKMIEALNRRLKGDKHVIVDGSVTGRLRKAAIDQFQRDPRTRVFIGNIQAAATGVDGLQRASSTSVIAELPWRPGDLYQLEGRTHRIGQEETTWYYFLISHGTIEERLCKVLQTKQGVIRTVLDGGVQPDDFSILDELLSELSKDKPRLLN